ncbi:MAG: hypothetical protein ACK5SI_15230, partial [Planctomycetia bacterium]
MSFSRRVCNARTSVRLVGLLAAGCVCASLGSATAAPEAAPAPTKPAAPATKVAEHGRWVIAADYARDGGLLLT